MCNADANLESNLEDDDPTDAGFEKDRPHQCKDYNALFEFAEKWRAFDGKSQATKTELKHEKSAR